MAYDAHKNFALSAVAMAPSPAASGTSLIVTAGQGALFPAVPFNATIWPANSQPISSNAEIVRVTAISTDTLTITRAQEGSSARTVIVGDQIMAGITARTLTDIEGGLIQPAIGVRVYQSAGQTIGTGANTTLTFDSESSDSNGFHDTGLNTSRLTVPTGYGGLYLIGANVQFGSNATGYRRAFFNLNGATTLGIASEPSASASVNSEWAFSIPYTLAAGDYVEVRAFQNSGGALATVGGAGGTHFWMIRIGA